MHIRTLGSTEHSVAPSNKSGVQARQPASSTSVVSSIQELSSKYDVRSMSGPEIRAMTDELIASGKLAAEDSMPLILMGELKRRQGLDHVKTNLVDAVRGAYDFAKVGGGRGDPGVLEQALSLLQRMDRVRQGQPETHWTA